VISRTSSMQYKGSRKSLPEVAQELGVQLIVEGSVQKAGDRVRVIAQLIDARRDEHMWARSYERKARDVLGLQGEVASAIAHEVKGALNTGQQSRLAQRKPVDPVVYDLYLRGRHAWNLRTPAGFQEAIGSFEQAIAKDPGFAPAYAGLADTYGLVSTSSADAGLVAKGREAAERAIALDDHLAEAHTSLAALRHRKEGDVPGAEREFRRALELNPGYATAHQWFAILLAEEGRDPEAIDHAQQAVALDPLSGAIRQTLGLVHYYGRRYGEAAAAERRALQLAPHLPLARRILGRSLFAQGDPRAAIEACEEPGAPPDADVLSTLAVAHLRAGDRTRADALVKKLQAQEPLPAGALARWYAAAGDPAAAFEMLERSLAQESSLRQLQADPVFDSLRPDGRFADLLRRSKLRSPAGPAG
jgi:tetratricopeptide (TPR) repeat protein